MSHDFFPQAAMQTSMQSSKPDTFILAPVSAQARLKRNRSELPLKTRAQPRIVCDLILETLQFAITDVIYFTKKIYIYLLYCNKISLIKSTVLCRIVWRNLGQKGFS